MDTKIISFNSYKGGACRTTTCYNTIPFLAEQLKASSQNPILLYDMDLDSMGLTNLIAEKEFDERPYSANVLFQPGDTRNNAFKDVENFESEYFTENYKAVGNHFGLEDNGAVLFLGVSNNQRNISEAEFERMKKNIADAPIASLVNEYLMDEDIVSPENRPAAIVFDCASGIQNTTLLLLRLISKFVVCMRPTTQFRIGTAQYILAQVPAQFRAVSKRKRECILLPTAVSDLANDKDISAQVAQELFDLRKAAYRDIKEEMVGDNKEENGDYFSVNASLVMRPDKMGIPEVDRFKWREGLLYKIAKEHGGSSALAHDEQNAYEMYQKLAEELAK